MVLSPHGDIGPRGRGCRAAAGGRGPNARSLTRPHRLLPRRSHGGLWDGAGGGGTLPCDQRTEEERARAWCTGGSAESGHPSAPWGLVCVDSLLPPKQTPQPAAESSVSVIWVRGLGGGVGGGGGGGRRQARVQLLAPLRPGPLPCSLGLLVEFTSLLSWDPRPCPLVPCDLRPL